MNEIIFETQNFAVEVPSRPFVDRAEGGHVRIMSNIKVRDRTKLSTEQALEYTLLSMLVGEALEIGMLKRGVEIGIVNYQEMGNWSVFKPEGVTMHMHIFGRAKSAIIQKYGEAVKLPFRETGFYEGFNPLDSDDLSSIKEEMSELSKSEKYKDLGKFLIN